MARVVLVGWQMKYVQKQPSIPAVAAVDLRTLLLGEHAQLEKLFEELVAAFRAGDREESAALWTAFESDLEAHMQLEEQQILPEFSKIDPMEAAALLREHAEIRTSVSELGIGVDLHCTNLEVVEDLLRRLGAHAQREDALMYRWAQKHRREGVHAATGPQRATSVREPLRTP